MSAPRRLRPTWDHDRTAPYGRAGGVLRGQPSIEELFERTREGAADPDRAVLIDDDVTFTAAGLTDLVSRLAAGLARRGVGRGDAVAFQLPNWWETVALFRACWRLGAVAAPIHHLAGPVDVDLVLDQVTPAVVLSAPDLPAAATPGALAVRGPDDTLADLAGGPGRHGIDARPDDLAVVLYTSGSSGGPKGVLHTHRALAYKASTLVAAHGLGRSDVVLMPSPMAHISGLSNAVMIPGAGGLASVLMARWDPARAVDLIEAHGVTFMMGPPTFFRTMAADPSFTAGRVATLRLISCGGAGVTPAFAAEASRQFGAVVKRTYGSTEAPAVTTWHAGDEPARAGGWDGRATGEVEIRIAGPDGAALPPGREGEIRLRGPELFVGYVDATRTAAAVHEGWFCTGDLGVMDDEGWLRVVGRIKDVIIRGGENISAAELEAVLEAHPAIRHAAVVGYPDERLGERVCAFVATSEPFDLDACRAWFAARGVTRFKWPERVEVLDELPLLVTGKADRPALRQRLAG